MCSVNYRYVSLLTKIFNLRFIERLDSVRCQLTYDELLVILFNDSYKAGSPVVVVVTIVRSFRAAAAAAAVTDGSSTIHCGRSSCHMGQLSHAF